MATKIAVDGPRGPLVAGGIQEFMELYRVLSVKFIF